MITGISLNIDQNKSRQGPHMIGFKPDIYKESTNSVYKGWTRDHSHWLEFPRNEIIIRLIKKKSYVLEFSLPFRKKNIKTDQ